LLEEITEYKAMVARLQSQADELQQQHRSLQLLHAITAEMSTATSLGESLERILFLTLAGLDARTIACWAAGFSPYRRGSGETQKAGALPRLSRRCGYFSHASAETR
jgi:hypothetical protein